MKNYLRNFTSPERLSNIVILSIKSQTDEINIEETITNFTNGKARKKFFLNEYSLNC